MKIYYSFDIQKKNSDKALSDVKTHLETFLVSEQVASSSQSHCEQYGTTEDRTYKFQWIGIELNRPGRLIGAVVSAAHLPCRTFFALEVIESHDYQKTLVNNKQRLMNWQTFIRQFMDSLANDTTLTQDEKTEQASSRLVQHEGRYRTVDTKQIEVLDAPINQGSMCFGAPGTGKSLVSHQRTEEYMRESLFTAYFAPTPLLIDATLKEIDARGLGRGLIQVFTWENFVKLMDTKPELAHFGFANELKKTLVNMDFFNHWYKELSKTALHMTAQFIRDIPDNIIPLLWHEFHNVFIQPIWSESSIPHLSEEQYAKLGIAQSNFPEDLRKGIYTHIFMPFYHDILKKNAYFPTLLAHRLYHAMQTTPQKLFDALVGDEIQKFHPWQLACMLSTLRNPLLAGQFCLVGDAGQGVETQAIRIAEPMKLFFEWNKASVQFYCLEINHRSSQAVTRFVAQIHELEHKRLGSSERDTHTTVRLSNQAPEGEITIRPFEATLRKQIEQDPNAYIVIPHLSLLQQACELWPTSQVVTLSEFQGMAADTIVMYGFSDYYDRQMTHINSTTDILPDWNAASSYARKSKGVWEALSERECLQALYTAASRAIHTLIMIEDAPLITRLHRACTPIVSSVMVEESESRMDTTTVMERLDADVPLEALQQVQIRTEQPKLSLKAWFLRARNDFDNGLILQAKGILCRRDLWSSAQIETLKSMLHQNDAMDWDAIESVLFPKNTVTPLSVSTLASSTSMITKALTAAPAPAPSSTESPLPPKWSAWVEELFNSLTASNIASLLKQPLLAQLLFSHTMKNGFCLYINLSLAEAKMNLFNKTVTEQKKLVLVTDTYNALKYKPVLLEVIWTDQPSKKGLLSSLIHKISTSVDEQSKYPLIYELLKTEIGIQRFITHFNLFKTHLIQTTFRCRIIQDGNASESSAFICLKNSVKGLSFLQKESSSLHRKELITDQQLAEILDTMKKNHAETPAVTPVNYGKLSPEDIDFLRQIDSNAKEVKSLGRSQNSRTQLVTIKTENNDEKNCCIKYQPCLLMSGQEFERCKADLLTLHHPSIIHYIDAKRESDTTVRLIMDYSDAGDPSWSSLDRWIQKFERSFPLEITFAFSKAVGLQLMMALSYLHQVGKTTHGCLTPEHILINKEGQVQLCNMTLAKFSKPSVPTESDCYNDRVAAGKIIYALANGYTSDQTQQLMALNPNSILTSNRFLADDRSLTTTAAEAIQHTMLRKFLSDIFNKTLSSAEAIFKHSFLSYERRQQDTVHIEAIERNIIQYGQAYGLRPERIFDDLMKHWSEIENNTTFVDEHKNLLLSWIYARAKLHQSPATNYIRTEIIPTLSHEAARLSNTSEWTIMRSLSKHVQYVQLSQVLRKRIQHGDDKSPMAIIKSLEIDEKNQASSHAIRRAITIITRSHHPNIVQLFAGTREGRNTVHILIEPCELGSLRQVIEADQIPRESIVAFLMATTCQILSGLFFLHTKLHVAHRNISTDHVLFTKDGVVKLCGFDASNSHTSVAPADMKQLSTMLLKLFSELKLKDVDNAIMLKEFALFIASTSPDDALQHEMMRPYYNDTCVIDDEIWKLQEELKANGIQDTTPIEQMKSWRAYDEANPNGQFCRTIRSKMHELCHKREIHAITTIRHLLQNITPYLWDPKIKMLQSIGDSKDSRAQLVALESVNGDKNNAVIKSQPFSFTSEAAFLRNRANLLKLVHPNIIRYRDAIKQNDTTVRLIMDYSDFGNPCRSSLDIWIKKFAGLFPTEMKRAFSKAIGLQLMLALSYLHHVGKTTHGFLTPEHILINKEGRVTLCNVKLAKFSHPSAPTEHDRYHDIRAAGKIIYALAYVDTLEQTQALMTLNPDSFLAQVEAIQDPKLREFLINIFDKTPLSSEACLKHSFLLYEKTISQHSAMAQLGEAYGLHPETTFEGQMKRWGEIENDKTLLEEQKNALREWMYARVLIFQEPSVDYIKTEILPRSFDWTVVKSLNEHVQYVQLNPTLKKRFNMNDNEPPMAIIKSLQMDESNEASTHVIRRAVTILERSHSPNITRMLAAWREGNTVQIICEPYEMGSLRHIITTAHIPRESMVTFLMATTCQILSGLVFLHAKLSVSHRSITTDHILFTKNGQVKLCGFDTSCNTALAVPFDMQQLSTMLLKLFIELELEDVDNATVLKEFANVIALTDAYTALQHESMHPYYNEACVIGDKIWTLQQQLKEYKIQGSTVEQMTSWRAYDLANPTSEFRYSIRSNMKELCLRRELNAITSISDIIQNVPLYFDAPEAQPAPTTAPIPTPPPVEECSNNNNQESDHMEGGLSMHR